MKKSLIALAVAGAFSAPAFAATENVDVYGKLHMSVSLVNDQPDSVNDVQISSNASRIGFKGAEDLGGGLSGIWQVESSLTLDENGGTLAGRNSFVGLKGGFGTVLLGNHDTPFKLVGRAVDLFGDTMADSRNILGQYEGKNTTSDMRAKNVAAYISPSFSGLSVAVAYSTDPVGTGDSGDANDMGVVTLNGTYTNGPIFAGIGYSTGDGVENGLQQDNNLRVAGGFTFGNAKIVAQYDSYESRGNVGDPADFSAWMVGGAYTMGNIVLKANYIAGEVDEVNGAEPTQWTIGADYNLSKRTSLYALYVSAEEGVILGNGGGSSDQFHGDGLTTADQDVSALSVGVIHSF